MANQRAQNKELVAAWMDRTLKRSTIAVARRHGFDDATDLVTVLFQRYLKNPFRKPVSRG